MTDFNGTWMCGEDDSSATLVIKQNGNQITVSGYDHSDGEGFDITEVTFDGHSLSFKSLMPSTGHQASHRVSLQEDGSMKHELTLIERWVRTETR